MRKTLTLLFVFSSFICFAQNYNEQLSPILSYSQENFDSDTCCWHRLSADKKYLEAANLIVFYLQTDKAINKHSLNWHCGQMFAMANYNKLAKKHFKWTYSIFYKWFGDTDAKTWYYYAKGTIAFIDNDKKKLEAIIRTWKNKYPSDNNLETLIRLNKNWGASYEQAYRIF